MPRFKTVDKENATGRARQLLDAVENKMGRIPNIVRLMANAPAALEGYLNFSAALRAGSLNPQLRERISIVIASANGCDYCLSAHTALGKMTGLPAEELAAAQNEQSSDERAAAALRFAGKLVRERGWASDDDVAELRQAGFTDGDIIEIIALVALNIFTNYFNHVAETEVDFPLVKATAG
ncbi:MAG: peroxidase-related enzyme [Blastocatellia bacterium]|nr:peroxidase-related enzyme [Blastocatellia bacterium]